MKKREVADIDLEITVNASIMLSQVKERIERRRGEKITDSEAIIACVQSCFRDPLFDVENTG